MRVCDAAMAVVTESKSPSLMWGDLNLCHAIAEFCILLPTPRLRLEVASSRLLELWIERRQTDE